MCEGGERDNEREGVCEGYEGVLESVGGGVLESVRGGGCW